MQLPPSLHSTSSPNYFMSFFITTMNCHLLLYLESPPNLHHPVGFCFFLFCSNYPLRYFCLSPFPTTPVHYNSTKKLSLFRADPWGLPPLALIQVLHHHRMLLFTYSICLSLNQHQRSSELHSQTKNWICTTDFTCNLSSALKHSP